MNLNIVSSLTEINGVKGYLSKNNNFYPIEVLEKSMKDYIEKHGEIEMKHPEPINKNIGFSTRFNNKGVY